MKLRSKILAALSLTTIGVATPVAISSCSCSSSFSINYGDKINCKDKNLKEITYHSINDVKNGAKTHVQTVEGSATILTWAVALDDLTNKNSSQKMQQFYWDLVYSAANDGVEYTLIWTVNKDEQKIVFNGTEYTSLVYEKDDNVWCIKTNTGAKLCKSYSLKYHD